MPVYEFRCEDCGRRFDVVATLKEKDAGLDPVCPKCGGTDCSLVFGKPTVITSSKTDEFDDDLGADEPVVDDDLVGDGLDDDLGPGDDYDDLG
jgi:putative FmdB family regulatory protein